MFLNFFRNILRPQQMFLGLRGKEAKHLFWPEGPRKRGNIVAQTSLLVNVSTASKRVRSKTNVLLPCRARNIFCVSDANFASATNVAYARKQGNICVRNNVSATMFPRLWGPLSIYPSITSSSKHEFLYLC